MDGSPESCQIEREPCDCPKCNFSAWSAWSGCASDSCTETKQVSTRAILQPSDCTACMCDEHTRYLDCPIAPAIDCVVSDWSAWSACSLCNADNEGLRIRQRTIEKPAQCKE